MNFNTRGELQEYIYGLEQVLLEYQVQERDFETKKVEVQEELDTLSEDIAPDKLAEMRFCIGCRIEYFEGKIRELRGRIQTLQQQIDALKEQLGDFVASEE